MVNLMACDDQKPTCAEIEKLHAEVQARAQQQQEAFAQWQTYLRAPARSADELDRAATAWEAARTRKWGAFDAYEAALKKLDSTYMTRSERHARCDPAL